MLDCASAARLLSNEEARVLKDIFGLCVQCKTVKPMRTHHCSQCARCVIRMDHHCVWIGNCVGKHNMKSFLLFLAYAFITCFYSITMCVVEISRCELFD